MGLERGLVTSLLLTLLFAAPDRADAQPYGEYDLRTLITPSPQGGATLDMELLDRILSDLEDHAGNYPPRFDTVFDLQRGTNDARVLGGLLEIIDQQQTSPSPELLLRLATTHAFAYNLDVPGAAEKATRAFERLITLAPMSGTAREAYGRFLFGSSRFAEAEAQLEKADELGAYGANVLLAQLHLVRNDRERALAAVDRFERRGGPAEVVRQLREVAKNAEIRHLDCSQTRPLKDADLGTFVIIERPTGKESILQTRISRVGDSWRVESRQGGPWQDIQCDGDCKLQPSSICDLERFYSRAELEQHTVECIHNLAFALCATSPKSQPTEKKFAMISLVTKEATRVELKRLAGPTPAAPKAP
ncbi:hypothetical protein L6R52_36390 [Myxococcota bacterium]|nr:hypothetical protein [Myxococcota bacterium]